MVPLIDDKEKIIKNLKKQLENAKNKELIKNLTCIIQD